MDELVSAAAAAGIALDKHQQRQLRAYFELLQERGPNANLTAVRGWERVRDELFVRSLRIQVGLRGVPHDARMIDIGTGAGIPGIVLKIAFPSLAVTLVDSTLKKIEIVAEIVKILGLDNVELVHARAEELGRELDHREAYDIAVARAVGPLAELAELMLPLTKIGGRAVSLKAVGIELELAAAAFAASELGATEAEVIKVDAPGNSAGDCVVVWRKVSPTPERYPRRPGVPHKRPLRAPRPARPPSGASAPAGRETL